MSEQDTKRRRRSGKREQRDGSSGQNPHLERPYIKRAIPTYDILSEDALLQIEATTDRIMVEIGFEFRDDPETVEMFKTASASVVETSPNRWHLKFRPGLIREILQSAPSQFTQHARNPANNVEIGGDNMVFAPAYGSPFVMDLDRGRRYGTIEDFQNFIKLGQMSPWLHHSGGTVCEPTDIAVNKRHLDMVYSHMTLSDRPFLGSVTAPERAADSVEMCRILFGADFVENNCVIMGNFNITSPLVIDDISSKGIREYAKANQGSIHTPFLLGGAVSPLTMAGSVAHCMAETMVSAAIAQLERPGAPIVLASFMSSMALRSGSPTFGTPEPALGSLVVGQLARRMKLPLRCAGNFSTSKLPDAQAMQQAMMSMMSGAQCGANYILHSAGFLDGLLSMSYEKFMLDLDLCGALHAYLDGILVTQDTLGFDALAEFGPGEHLFSTQHTLRHYKTAYYDSALDDNQPWETWDEQGCVDMATRANQRWKAQLAAYQPPAMDEAKNQELRTYIEAKKAMVEDMWY